MNQQSTSSTSTHKLLHTAFLAILGLSIMGCATHEATTRSAAVAPRPVAPRPAAVAEQPYGSVASADDFQSNAMSGNFERNPPFGPRSNKSID